MLCGASVKLRRASKFRQYSFTNLTRKALAASYRGRTSDYRRRVIILYCPGGLLYAVHCPAIAA